MPRDISSCSCRCAVASSRGRTAGRPFDAVLDYLLGEPAEQVLGAPGNNELAARYERAAGIPRSAGARAFPEPSGTRIVLVP